MTTKVTSGLISADAASVDLNIDNTTLYLDASENKVGIGTSTPAAKLDVASSSNSTYLRIGGDDASNGRGLTFVSSASAAFNGAVHTITAPSSQGAIALKGYNTEGLRVVSDGKVGIGTTTPQYQMLTVKSSSSTGNNLRLETGSELAVVSVDDSGDLTFFAHGADERIKFLNGVGSGTNIAAFDSHGLKFGSDTAAANALDDYEEGVYVATITCSTSGTASLNGAYSDLSYTKIGRLVTVTGLLIVSSVSSPVGYYTINLPFAPANLTDRAGDSAATIIHHYGNNAGAGAYIVMINEGNANLLVYRGDVGTTRSENSAQELRAGTQLNISATYVTT